MTHNGIQLLLFSKLDRLVHNIHVLGWSDIGRLVHNINFAVMGLHFARAEFW